MNDPGLDSLLARVSRSSNRLRVAMGVTAVLCLLLVAGIAADPAMWTGGWGWRIGGAVGMAFFGAVAVLLAYAVFWRQQRHVSRLRRTLTEDPHTIRSIRLLVARAVPVASWSPDDGSARTGLHIVVEDDAGRNWVLPVSRADADTVVDALRRRCPQAAAGP
ncbi:MAG: hypothetical protein QG655_296 [Actinomycetota bacterium]|nr:hypothetical protein [Actinomycetota bacterium]